MSRSLPLLEVSLLQDKQNGPACVRARFLAERGVAVVEVNRPNRQNRPLRGKSDTVDAEAARAVLNSQANVIPKAGTGPVEAVRQLRIALAMKARTAAANQLHSLCLTTSALSSPA